MNVPNDLEHHLIGTVLKYKVTDCQVYRVNVGEILYEHGLRYIAHSFKSDWRDVAGNNLVSLLVHQTDK